MTFEILLFLVAKIGFASLVFIFLVRWILVIPYLWLRYDKPILKLKEELYDFRIDERSHTNLQAIVDGRIGGKTQEINEKLDILETKRRLFLDKLNLFLSIASIDKK